MISESSPLGIWSPLLPEKPVAPVVSVIDDGFSEPTVGGAGSPQPASVIEIKCKHVQKTQVWRHARVISNDKYDK